MDCSTFSFSLRTEVASKEAGRLDGDQRSELQDVALNHVAQRAGGFVEAAAPLHAQRFRRR